MQEYLAFAVKNAGCAGSIGFRRTICTFCTKRLLAFLVVHDIVQHSGEFLEGHGAQIEKVPYMVIVGDRDIENGTVSPRHRSDGDLGAMSFEDFAALVKDVVDTRAKK